MADNRGFSVRRLHLNGGNLNNASQGDITLTVHGGITNRITYGNGAYDTAYSDTSDDEAPAIEQGQGRTIGDQEGQQANDDANQEVDDGGFQESNEGGNQLPEDDNNQTADNMGRTLNNAGNPAPQGDRSQALQNQRSPRSRNVAVQTTPQGLGQQSGSRGSQRSRRMISPGPTPRHRSSFPESSSSYVQPEHFDVTPSLQPQSMQSAPPQNIIASRQSRITVPPGNYRGLPTPRSWSNPQDRLRRVMDRRIQARRRIDRTTGNVFTPTSRYFQHPPQVQSPLLNVHTDPTGTHIREPNPMPRAHWRNADAPPRQPSVTPSSRGQLTANQAQRADQQTQQETQQAQRLDSPAPSITESELPDYVDDYEPTSMPFTAQDNTGAPFGPPTPEGARRERLMQDIRQLVSNNLVQHLPSTPSVRDGNRVRTMPLHEQTSPDYAPSSSLLPSDASSLPSFRSYIQSYSLIDGPSSHVSTGPSIPAHTRQNGQNRTSSVLSTPSHLRSANLTADAGRTPARRPTAAEIFGYRHDTEEADDDENEPVA